MSKLGVFCVIAPSPPPGESSPVHQPGEHSVRLSHYSQGNSQKNRAHGPLIFFPHLFISYSKFSTLLCARHWCWISLANKILGAYRIQVYNLYNSSIQIYHLELTHIRVIKGYDDDKADCLGWCRHYIRSALNNRNIMWTKISTYVILNFLVVILRKVKRNKQN